MTIVIFVMAKKKIKQPVQRKVAKTPLIMQLESLECGAASLAMIMAYYGKWVPLEQVREDAAVSRDGANARNILRAAKKYGFKTDGYAISGKKLRETGKFPCIIHWNRAHFVVLRGFRGKYAVINDPAKGVIHVKMEDFLKSFSGIYLEIVPDEHFEPSGKRKSILSFAKKRLVGATSLIVVFTAITIITYVIGLADPLLKQSFVDRVLGAGNKALLTFILIVSAVALGSAIITLIKQIYNYRMLGRLAVESSSSFLWKILRLPIAFFSQRMVGDIQKRKTTNANIASTLVNVFAPLLLNVIMLVVYLILMLQRSYILTLIGVVAITINVLVAQIAVQKRIDIARVYARDDAMLAALSSKGIENIETLKSSGAEQGYFMQWSEAKEAASANKKKLAFFNNASNLIPNVISLAIECGILFLGVYFTMIGEFTVGAILAFQGLLGALMSPATSLIQSGQTLQEMRTEMERVDDVMEYPDDPNVTKQVQQDEYVKNVPTIELKNVTFGYNKLDEPLIKNFSLSIPRCSTVAIVGGSGCGKSTLAKLISGLYAPWEGEILFDGKPIVEIDRDIFSNLVSVVDQDIVLFEDSVSNNIKMWDDTVADFEMILAAKDASIHSEIAAKGGYQYQISEGGKNFSGGERQRIEIARALANDPSVLILDEATSALDAQTEYEIVKAIRKRNITCIVVAHRLSTVRNADKILVMNEGSIAEMGTHEELMAKRGRYYELIQNA